MVESHASVQDTRSLWILSDWMARIYFIEELASTEKEEPYLGYLSQSSILAGITFHLHNYLFRAIGSHISMTYS